MNRIWEFVIRTSSFVMGNPFARWCAMKYQRLLLTNLFRNKRRSALTVTSIAMSLFLVATLLTVLSELEDPPQTPASALRLICRHRVSMTSFLPKAHRVKISKVEGVEDANLKIGTVTIGMIQRFAVTSETLGICAATGLPAWRAASRPVVEILREV